MKVENIKKAGELAESLKDIESKICKVEQMRGVCAGLSKYGGQKEVYLFSFKYDKEMIMEALKSMMLQALEKEKKDIIAEIEGLE